MQIVAGTFHSAPPPPPSPPPPPHPHHPYNRMYVTAVQCAYCAWLLNRDLTTGIPTIDIGNMALAELIRNSLNRCEAIASSGDVSRPCWLVIRIMCAFIDA